MIDRVQPRRSGTDAALTLDSLQFVELLLDIEEEFEISIGRDLPEYSLSSVAALERALAALIEKKGRA